MCELGGVAYYDQVYTQGPRPSLSRAEWNDVKPGLGLDFPNLPYLATPGGLVITQSGAINRFIAARAGLLGGGDEATRARVDMLDGASGDARSRLVRVAYAATFEQDKAAVREALERTSLAWLEAWIAKGPGPWLAGAECTLADVSWYDVLDTARLMHPGILDKFPGAAALVKRFEEQPAVAAYLASDRFERVRPCNNASAQFR